jgi:hypothetical protein
MGFELTNEFPPFVSNVLEEATKELNTDILVHLLVQLTVQYFTLSCLPAFIMLATIDLLHLRFILSEIQALSWMNLTSNSQLEVFVRDLSILVQIELVK